MSDTPVAVQAVDAFGVEAVRSIFPNWERRNDLTESDFAEVAVNSGRVFATNGTVLLPAPYLKLEGKKLHKVAADIALKLFGLRALANVGEKGVSPLTPLAKERFIRALATKTIAGPSALPRTISKAAILKKAPPKKAIAKRAATRASIKAKAVQSRKVKARK